MRVVILLTSAVLLSSITLFAQQERYTKGAENGHTWQQMGRASLLYDPSKESYLSSILERIQISKENHPEIDSLSCSSDINKLISMGNSEEITLENVVEQIDIFYSKRENLIIPIIFAYCYCIKEFAGASKIELNDYREKLLIFCNE